MTFKSKDLTWGIILMIFGVLIIFSRQLLNKITKHENKASNYDYINYILGAALLVMGVLYLKTGLRK